MLIATERKLSSEDEQKLRDRAFGALWSMWVHEVLPDRRLAKLIKSMPISSWTKNRPYP